MIQNRKKAKFNLLDALIIILMLALIGAVIYGLFGGFRDSESAEPSEFTFDVKISNVRESALALIAEGMEIKDSVTGEAIGTVVSVKTEKSRYYGGVQMNENGIYSLIVSDYPDEYDVYVTISASAEKDDRDIFYVGDIRMLVGETVHFQVKSFSAVSYIVKTASRDSTGYIRERKTDMDQKQKRISGARFNIFDFLIILGILVCIIAVVARAILISNAKNEIEYTDVYFEVKGVSDATARALCIPDAPIYLQSNDVKIGFFDTVDSKPLTVWAEDENGYLIEALHPDKHTVYGIAQIKGIWYDEGFLVDGTYIVKVGQTFDIYTKYASCTITVTAIAEKS